MTFGKRLKTLRVAAKKSQKDIEAETKIPQTTLSGWENDKTEPTASDIVKLANVLGVTVTDILEDYNSKDYPATYQAS